MQNNTEQSLLSKVRVISNLAIATIALVFTFLYQTKQNEILETQVVISKASVVGNLIPLLTSKNPKERIFAFEMIESIYPSLTIPISKDFIVNDPTDELQRIAEKNIRAIIKDNPPQDIYSNAKKIINIIDVLEELKTKGLLNKLVDAKSYFRSGNEAGERKGIELYTTVLNEMSIESKGKLDQELLLKAETHIRKGDLRGALLHYLAAFSNFS